jgi:hypothetical protein
MIADAVYLLFAALNFYRAASRSMIVRGLSIAVAGPTRQLRIGLLSAAKATRLRLVDQELLTEAAATRGDRTLPKCQVPPISGPCPGFLTPGLYAN